MLQFGQWSIANYSGNDDKQRCNHSKSNCIIQNCQSNAKLDTCRPCLMEPVREFPNPIGINSDIVHDLSRRMLNLC
uniref:Uncharacterized protein n=1 Tax=Arundo donax TaxID=35708 RepID=A0A0A9GMH8_ARUDO